jgi:5-methylcytosine-specific restriction endonuclease McrBC GTP-binding regulatory subunit McrB
MNEEEFKKWWFNDNSLQDNGQKYANSTKEGYFYALKQLISNKDIKLFDNDNIQELKSLLHRLEQGDLREYNQRNRNMDTSNGLKHYIKFLEANCNLSTLTKEIVNNYIQTKNIILYGTPGIGKTHNLQNLISLIEEGKDEKTIFDTIRTNEKVNLNSDIYKTIKNENRVQFITFHQSYSYEDFIEGFRPQNDGNIKLIDGIFKDICQSAIDNRQKSYYLIIDEINRANISKVFGELITLIEEDKRDDYEVILPYSKKSFQIPSNLFIIATMNSTDKSIATIDIALRRRFTFLKMSPNIELVEYKKANELMKKLNKFIKDNLSEDYMLGHSYFMKISKDNELEFVKEYKIKPLLEEYFYADDTKLDEVLKILDL